MFIRSYRKAIENIGICYALLLAICLENCLVIRISVEENPIASFSHLFLAFNRSMQRPHRCIVLPDKVAKSF